MTTDVSQNLRGVWDWDGTVWLVLQIDENTLESAMIPSPRNSIGGGTKTILLPGEIDKLKKKMATSKHSLFFAYILL